MLSKESVILVSDNTGVFSVKIISSYSKKFVKVGDFVLSAVKKSRIGKTYQSKYLALILALRVNIKRKSGIFYKYDENTCLLLKDKETLVGSRLDGIIDATCKVARSDKLQYLTKSFI